MERGWTGAHRIRCIPSNLFQIYSDRRWESHRRRLGGNHWRTTCASTLPIINPADNDDMFIFFICMLGEEPFVAEQHRSRGPRPGDWSPHRTGVPPSLSLSLPSPKFISSSSVTLQLFPRSPRHETKVGDDSIPLNKRGNGAI